MSARISGLLDSSFLLGMIAAAVLMMMLAMAKMDPSWQEPDLVYCPDSIRGRLSRELLCSGGEGVLLVVVRACSL